MPGITTQVREFSPSEKKSPAIRVLVVDDEPLIRWSVAETLTDGGHDVVEAPDGRSALDLLTRTVPPIDVVVLDLRLPDSSDLGLLARVRALSPSSQVIMMTAFGTPEVARGALALGAYRVVAKPFELQELAELVLQAHNSRIH